MAVTYILYSEQLDRYYIGHTEDVMENRLRHHLSGHCGFTSRAKDWIVVYQKEFASKSEAYEFERMIKKLKSKKAIQRLIGGI